MGGYCNSWLLQFIVTIGHNIESSHRGYCKSWMLQFIVTIGHNIESSHRGYCKSWMLQFIVTIGHNIERSHNVLRSQMHAGKQQSLWDLKYQPHLYTDGTHPC